MEFDPSKQRYNNHANTGDNQSQLGISNGYSLDNVPPPPYAPYSHQPPDYHLSTLGYPDRPPSYRQQSVVVTHADQQQYNRLLIIPITSTFKKFLIVSGFLSLIWGILAMSLEVGIILTSNSILYRGLWVGGFLIGVGISLFIAAFKQAYRIYHFQRLFIVTLLFVQLGFILSIINLSTSARCDSYDWDYDCNEHLATHLKISILILFIIATIHTIINIIMVNRQLKIATGTSLSNVPRN